LKQIDWLLRSREFFLYARFQRKRNFDCIRT